MDLYKELRNPNNYLKWIPEAKEKFSLKDIMDTLFPLYDLSELLMFDYNIWLET